MIPVNREPGLMTGSKLRCLRIQYGIKQYALADRLAVAQNLLVDVEAECLDFTPEMWQRIQTVLKEDYLITPSALSASLAAK